MKLEDIGFYTLSEARVKQTCLHSPMWRTEIILTHRCNFKCPYCRGLKPELQGDMSIEKVKSIIDIWSEKGLKNIRFSGGEPTLYPYLKDAIRYAKLKGVERIAISTNGSMPLEYYISLIDEGVNDISISLDACCSSYGDKMCGGIKGMWEKVVNNIKELSKMTYISLGMVFTEETAHTVKDTILFGHSLGVSDIRIISSAQSNIILEQLSEIPERILDAHPILRYRIKNFIDHKNVRGINKNDSHRCAIVIDDSAIAGDYHYPCIIYLREGGSPIGEINPKMREERYEWFKNHDTHCDKICQKNCLDVCIAYNNSYRYYESGRGWREKVLIDNDFGILSKIGLIEKLKNNRRSYNGIFIDFDGVKILNEQIGYAAVNSVLKDVFASYDFREDDVVARYFSGDEIVILTHGDANGLMARFEKHCMNKGMTFKCIQLKNIISLSDIEKEVSP